MHHIVSRAIAALCLIAAVALADARPVAAQSAPVREISNIAGDLYRFRNNFHFSVFYVTPAGILVTDPINADAAKWLKAELARRFPDRPIRYLVYSHDHADHASGGEVFADTATVIAQENAKYHIVAEKRPTAVPHITFRERLDIDLGGKTVQLHYLGRNHSDNSLVMLFPAERVAFAVDFAPIKSIAFRDFPNAFIEEWIGSLRQLEAMDYDVLAPGHGALGSRADVAAFRRYMEELRSAVLTHVRAGKSLEETKQSVQMESYKDWAGYRDVGLNVEGMYRHAANIRRSN